MAVTFSKIRLDIHCIIIEQSLRPSMMWIIMQIEGDSSLQDLHNSSHHTKA